MHIPFTSRTTRAAAAFPCGRIPSKIHSTPSAAGLISQVADWKGIYSRGGGGIEGRVESEFRRGRNWEMLFPQIGDGSPRGSAESQLPAAREALEGAASRRRPRGSKMRRLARRLRCTKACSEVVTTPSPYFIERRKLIEDASS